MCLLTEWSRCVCQQSSLGLPAEWSRSASRVSGNSSRALPAEWSRSASRVSGNSSRALLAEWSRVCHGNRRRCESTKPPPHTCHVSTHFLCVWAICGPPGMSGNLYTFCSQTIFLKGSNLWLILTLTEQLCSFVCSRRRTVPSSAHCCRCAACSALLCSAACKQFACQKDESCAPAGRGSLESSHARAAASSLLERRR